MLLKRVMIWQKMIFALNEEEDVSFKKVKLVM